MKQDVTTFTGLSNSEVQEAYHADQLNKMTQVNQNDYWPIIKRNAFSLFNLLNLIIAIILGLVGAWSNMVFMLGILVNALSGILVEIRAKWMVDKLNLLSKEPVRTIRDSKTVKIKAEELVLGDLIELSAGEQVPSDGKVIAGFAEVNEAMLTGESDFVKKDKGAEVLSGSYLTSGHIYVILTRVGDDNYAAQLMRAAKQYKPTQSQIISSLDKIASFTGKILLPFGVILLLEAIFVKAIPVKEAVIYTAAPMLGMLPKGIALLTISSLLTAVLKLGQKNVLVQEMYSVETLAHVDTLCLDKTGTITEGKMSVEKSISYMPSIGAYHFEDYLTAYMTASEDQNPTAQAIRQYLGDRQSDFTVVDSIPFSSGRKWGAISFAELGSVFLGAPELLTKERTTEMRQGQEEGARVLALCHSKKAISSGQSILPIDLTLLGIIVISDPIRKGVKKTLDYLKSQEVDLRIISGDNPVTVSNIARKAGFDSYQRYLDCSTLSYDELDAAIATTTIFGRVTPEQKKQIVQKLKSLGRTVAMTGDGVNDILALREADCSIAMAEGDPATRQVSNLVLLQSDFNDVPEILFEGRRVVNNIAKVSPIFLIKSVYSFAIAIICILSVVAGPKYLLVYPFMPLQLTLVSQFIDGFPPFVLSFERNNKHVEKDFLGHAIRLALPGGLLISFSVLVANILAPLLGWSQIDLNTISYYLLGLISILSVIKAYWPLNWWKSGLILFWSLLGFISTAILLKKYLSIGLLNASTFPVFITLLVLSVIIFIVADRYIEQRDQAKI